MADLKISQLTGATTPLAGTEVLPIVQSSSTVKVAVSNLTAGRSVSMSDATLSTGNLNFSSTGQRITGDFSNATLINRVSFQSTTTNGNTRIPIIPNGTATTSELVVFNNSTPTDSQGLAFFISNTQTSIRSNGYGTGISSYLPLTFYTNGTEQVNIDTSGNITFKTGNLTQGTAARGINFTANTPLAGKTSQLLNYYEEGTWTVTLTPGTSGTIGLYTTFDECQYTRIGRMMFVSGQIKIISTSSPVGTYVRMSLPSTIADLPEIAGRMGSTVSKSNVVYAALANEGANYIDIQTAASGFAVDEIIAFSFSYVTA